MSDLTVKMRDFFYLIYVYGRCNLTVVEVLNTIDYLLDVDPAGDV